jgi:hypothetical protein
MMEINITYFIGVCFTNTGAMRDFEMGITAAQTDPES